MSGRDFANCSFGCDTSSILKRKSVEEVCSDGNGTDNETEVIEE